MKKINILWWYLKCNIALGVFNVLSFFGFVEGRFGNFVVGILAELEKQDPR